MRAVIQRAASASVTLKATGERRAIGPGLVTLLGIAHGDTPADAKWLAEKLVGLRVFEDAEGKMNRALSDLAGEGGGAMLIVSQFTLSGTRGRGGGRRSSARPRRTSRCRCMRRSFRRCGLGRDRADGRVRGGHDRGDRQRRAGDAYRGLAATRRGTGVPAMTDEVVALHPDALDGQRHPARHRPGEAGGEGVGLTGEQGGGQGDAPDLGVGGREAQAQRGVGGQAAVDLDVPPVPLKGDGGPQDEIGGFTGG